MEYHVHMMPAARIENSIDVVAHIAFWTMDICGCDSGNHDASYLPVDCLKYAPRTTTADFSFSKSKW